MRMRVRIILLATALCLGAVSFLSFGDAVRSYKEYDLVKTAMANLEDATGYGDYGESVVDDDIAVREYDPIPYASPPSEPVLPAPQEPIVPAPDPFPVGEPIPVPVPVPAPEEEMRELSEMPPEEDIVFDRMIYENALDVPLNEQPPEQRILTKELMLAQEERLSNETKLAMMVEENKKARSEFIEKIFQLLVPSITTIACTVIAAKKDRND